MAVELPADVQERCTQLGKGVGYALKAHSSPDVT